MDSDSDIDAEEDGPLLEVEDSNPVTNPVTPFHVESDSESFFVSPEAKFT